MFFSTIAPTIVGLPPKESYSYLIVVQLMVFLNVWRFSLTFLKLFTMAIDTRTPCCVTRDMQAAGSQLQLGPHSVR